MLQPFIHQLNSELIVLASGSPRRRDILKNIGLKFEIEVSTFEENLDKNRFSSPEQYAMATARAKGLEVANRLLSQQRPARLIIAADTVLGMDGKIFEKPLDTQQACDMLMGFSGRSHIVYTGVSLITYKPAADENGPFNVCDFWEKTDVCFAKIDLNTIKAYVDSGEPMDKAGGYGIQAAGGTLIEGIHGDYFNVMGFPLHRFAKEVVRLHREGAFDHA